ncbi:MAG: fibronectin-binding domain-containing protein [Methanomassiliicoccales archaeon]|nr:MAG: fibronectin-binding domain-containing protein [Methanomassiliicoccales archaeon]
MKKAMSSFDLMAVAQELQVMIGGRFDKAFQTKDELSIRVGSKEIGKKDIFSKAGKWLFLRDPRKGKGQPGTFAMVLRKHLSNARFTKVEQHDFDRVLVLDFEKKERFQLIFELFSRGNAVLVKEGKIVNPLRRESWSSREIKIGEDYKFPPSHQNPQSLSQSEFESIIKESEKDLVRTLALDFNLGGQYSEELCLRSGIDKKSRAGELSSELIGKIYGELQNIFQDVLTKKSPNVVIEDEQVFDAAPISLRQHESLESRAFESVSEALEFFVSSLEVDVEEVEEEDETARFERRIKQQVEAMDKSLEKEKLYREIADYLHANPSHFEKLLEELKSGSTEDANVKSINHEKSIARMALPDGKEFELNYRNTVYDNANHFYEKAKKEKSKRDRLKVEIAKSQQAMEKVAKQRERREKLPKMEPTKHFWFDTYRWFVSSEGHLVIAGRDARSNDRIVKRHLKDGDRYAHADIKGAPSVVIKEGSKATDVTLREACEFALSFSKAWSSRVGGGSAYWVKPEQVSKHPESGEFLPRGAFVVRGKRNHFRGLELQVAVGEIEYEGSRKVMCGPISAVEPQSKRFAVLRPGETKKEEIAKELSRVFQVPVDEMSRILPPGGIEIVQKRI